MASGSKSGRLYLLCLSREALRELYEHHLQDQLSVDVTTTYLLFGAEPYSFADSRHHSEPAPLREFGVLKTSQKTRRRVYNSLPSAYQAIIDAHHPDGAPFGPYVDGEGRYYKFESARTLTVLIPKGQREKVEFPEPNDFLMLRHVDDPNRQSRYTVDIVGQQRGNTCLLHCIENV